MDDESKRREDIEAAAHGVIELLLNSSAEEAELFRKIIRERVAELPVKLNSGIIVPGKHDTTRNGHSGKNKKDG
jgi:hypothetical protein